MANRKPLVTFSGILQELPAADALAVDITGNAGTVTNGVYTTGNQTIGGIKTFSSQVNTPNVRIGGTEGTYNTTDIVLRTQNSAVTQYIDTAIATGGWELRSHAGALNFATMFAVTPDGNVSWPGTATGIGSGLTSLNASNLGSGTVPDARLSGTYTNITSIVFTGGGAIGTFSGGAHATLVGGSTNGGLWRGSGNGHAVVMIDGNDDGDSFAVVSYTGTDQTSDKTPDTLAFKVARKGNLSWPGVATGNGSGITTLNAGNLSSGLVPIGRLTNTFAVNGSGPSEQPTGLYVADLGTTIGTTNNPRYTAAICAQLNVSRSIALTVDDQGYLYGYRSHNNAGTYTWQSKARFADTLTTARNINGVAFDGSSNITVADDTKAPLTGTGTSGTWPIGVTGNAGTATVLATARTINGTSFNGSANITTANWGTSRTITIGATGKSVNGSGNVSWTLAEIGAEASTPVGTTSQFWRGDKSWQDFTTTARASIAGPAFSAHLNSNQTINHAVFTKLANFGVEEFNTAGCFEASRFTATVAGYYQFSASGNFSTAANGVSLVTFYKNGARAKDGTIMLNNTANGASSVASGLIYLNGTTDYVELYAYQTSGSPMVINAGVAFTYFQGFLAERA